MADETLDIRVRTTTDASGLDRARKSLDNLQGVASKVTDAFGRFGLAVNGIKSAFGILAAPIKGLIEGLDTLGEEYAVLNRQTQRFEASIRGLPLEEHRKQLEAIENENLRTGIATDKLTELTATYNNALEDRTQATKFLQSTLDVAIASETKEETVLKATRLAIIGKTTSLEKLIPRRQAEIAATKAITNASEREAEILRIMQDEYGGMRDAINKGVTSLRSMKTSLGDIVEEMGKAIFENKEFQKVITGVALAFRLVVRHMGNLLRIFGTYLQTLMGVTQGQAGVAKSATVVLEVINYLGQAFVWTTGTVKALANAFEVVLGAAIVAVVGLAKILLDVLGALAKGMLDLFADILESVAYLPDAFLESIGLSSQGINKFANQSRSAVKDIEKAQKTLTDAVEKSKDRTTQAWDTMLDPMVEAEITSNRIAVEFSKMIPVINQLGAELEDLINKGTDGGRRGAVGDGGDGTKKKKLEYAELAAAVASYRSEVEAALDAQSRIMDFSLSESHEGLIAAQEVRKQIPFAKVTQEMAQAQAKSKALMENFSEVDYWLTNVSGAAAEEFSNQFGTMFSSILDGSKSFGDALQDTLLSVIQTLAKHFAELFVAVGIGLQAATALGPVGLFIAAAALAGLALGVAAIMGGSEAGGAPVAQQTIEPVRREAEEDSQERGGRATFIFNGIATDDRQVAKALGQLMGLAEQMNVWSPSR